MRDTIVWLYDNQSVRLIGGRMSATLVKLALGALVQLFDNQKEPGQEEYALFHHSLRHSLNNLARSGRFTYPPEDVHRAITDYHFGHVS